MLLIIIFYLLIIGIFAVIFTPSHNKVYLELLGIYTTGLVFICSTILVVFFNCNQLYFQALSIFYLDLTIFNMEYSCGIDGLSLVFFVLSSLLIFLCTIFILNEIKLKYYLVLL